MSTQEQVQARIDFLQTQLDSLDHYLPETYQLLLKEMDLQQRDLMELKIQDFYSNQDNEQQHQNPDTGDTDQTQKSNHQRARIQQWVRCDWLRSQDPLWPPQEATPDMSNRPISITLDQVYSNKIQVIQEAISDPTTHKMIVEGLVDTGYANALKTLHSAGRISDSVLEQGIRKLPDYLQATFDSWNPMGPPQSIKCYGWP
jgi:hypothetical protein